MNPMNEITRLLEDNGAVLVRQKKHRVYKVAGATFVQPNTSGDRRASANGLSDLRKLLPKTVQAAPPAVGPPEPTPPQDPPPVTPPVPELPPLQNRIAASIASMEAERENLFAQASALDRRINFLQDLLKHAAEMDIGAILLSLQPPPPPAAVAPPPPCILVSRDLIRQAVKDITGTFTADKVTDILQGSLHVSPEEYSRARKAAVFALRSMVERGEVRRAAPGHRGAGHPAQYETCKPS